MEILQIRPGEIYSSLVTPHRSLVTAQGGAFVTWCAVKTPSFRHFIHVSRPHRSLVTAGIAVWSRPSRVPKRKAERKFSEGRELLRVK
jgi:hypothetical protein